MIIKQGQRFTVKDSEKGWFKGEAISDFDTEKDYFYPIITLEYVEDWMNEWYPGEEISCRKGISEIILEADRND